MSDPKPAVSPSRSTRLIVISLIVLGGLVALLYAAASIWTDVLWYRQLGYLQVLTTQWGSSAVMFAIGFLGMAAPLWLSIWLSFRSQPTYVRVNATLDQYQRVLEPLRTGITWGLPIFFGLIAGLAAASNWTTAQLWLNGVDTGTTDAQFGLDLGFYMFDLPFYQQVVSFALVVVLLSAVLLVALSYLYGAIRIEQRRLRVAKTTRVQLAVTIAVYVALQAVQIWLSRYQQLTDSSGLFTGAGYTSVNAVIPGQTILAAIAVLVVIGFVVAAVTGRWRVSLVGGAVLVVAALVIGVAYPWGIQAFRVQPSERSLEQEYLQRNIDATRAAYGLDGLDVEEYDAVTTAQAGALRSDVETTASIRLLDPELVSDTFRQLQQYKQYYQFGASSDAALDVDRYDINGSSVDTVLAVRELSQQPSDSWYNNTIVYTHGYGVVAAYGNQVTSDGKPIFFESNIPVSGALEDYEPRIYFGENSPEYSIVGGDDGGSPNELDYPASSSAEGDDTASSDSNQTYTTFSGDGGPVLSDGLTKLLYAMKFGSIEILTSDAVSSGSQILYDRDPVDRVQKVAPYLTLDSDPYPAVVDGRVQWVIDGYTTSNSYPYSNKVSYNSAINDSTQSTTRTTTDSVNYVRNSVKATVDAYDGSVKLYAWDTEDPVLQTWQKVFPSTLAPISEMSAELLSHVRYPTDLFKVQRLQLGTYHVTDAGSFYSNEDAWQVPADPQASTDSGAKQSPYYLTMKLPGQSDAAFTLYSTFIPVQQSSGSSRNVLRGYLAANGDAGSIAGEKSESYGKLTLLQLPGETNVPGPGQVQNLFDSDNTVSTELNLLRQGQTTVTSGNLLTLPVGDGLLYVQPVYVRSTGETSYPLLRKILVAFGDQVAFEDTLDAALDDIFGGDSGAVVSDGAGASSSGSSSTTDGSPSNVDGSALSQALETARQALQEREAARVSGDWAAYGTADAKLQQAINDAISSQQ